MMQGSAGLDKCPKYKSKVTRAGVLLSCGLLAFLAGCTSISSIPSDDVPTPVKAAAVVADAAVTWRLWQLGGWVK